MEHSWLSTTVPGTVLYITVPGMTKTRTRWKSLLVFIGRIRHRCISLSVNHPDADLQLEEPITVSK